MDKHCKNWKAKLLIPKTEQLRLKKLQQTIDSTILLYRGNVGMALNTLYFVFLVSVGQANFQKA